METNLSNDDISCIPIFSHRQVRNFWNRTKVRNPILPDLIDLVSLVSLLQLIKLLATKKVVSCTFPELISKEPTKSITIKFRYNQECN